MSDEKMCPIVVVGGTSVMREEFCGHFGLSEEIAVAHFPTRLAARLCMQNLPQLVVFLPPYSSEMLRQVSQKGVHCIVLENWGKDVDLVESTNIIRFYHGPFTILPYASLHGFAKEVLHAWRM